MEVDNALLFQKVYSRARSELVPKLTVGSKKDFKIHIIINWILNLVYPSKKKDAYLEWYNTTLGFTVAMALRVGDKIGSFENWRTLCHEVQHALQAKRWTRVVFGYLYLWPVSQGVVVFFVGWVGVIWIPGWWKFAYLASWLVVTGIHFIPQLPDPWRTRWEFEAYSVSIHLRNLHFGCVDYPYLNRVAFNFNSMIYYMMHPNKDKITKRLTDVSLSVVRGNSPVSDFPIVRIAEEEYQKLLNAGT